MLDGMFGSPGMRQLEGRLAALVAGQSALAQEVANAATPGYTGAGVGSFQTSLQAALSAQMGGATPGGTGRPALVAAVPPVSPPGGGVQLAFGGGAPAAAPAAASGTGGGAGALTPDGNGMSVNALMVDVAENDLNYQAVARQMQLIFQNIGDAIGASTGSSVG